MEGRKYPTLSLGVVLSGSALAWFIALATQLVGWPSSLVQALWLALLVPCSAACYACCWHGWARKENANS